MKFFIDFDGTISNEDVVDKILERFGAPEWQAIEAEWAAGKIGSRECLSRQLALVRAGSLDIESLMDQITIDPFFPEFLQTAEANQVPVFIVSDGFDFVIHGVLKRRLSGGAYEKLKIFCNRLGVHKTFVRAFFPAGECEHGCANCKQRILKNFVAPDEKIIFVGDGLSDRYAAQTADFTFAKKKLLEFCRANQIRHKEYSNFRQISEWVAGKERVLC